MTKAEERLDEHGYLVLEEFMGAELLNNVRARVKELLDEEGEKAGAEFKQELGARRLANLMDKGEIFQTIVVSPEILQYVGFVLGPRFKLSSLNVRSASPYNEVQPLHADSGAIVDEQGYWVCNSLWMLDEITEQNAAVRVVPGSHRRGRLPEDVLEDPRCFHPDEILLTGAAGTVVIMNSHLWHGAAANRTERPRIAMHAFYTRWDKPQQQYQKQLIRPQVQSQFSAELRRLLALDDPLNDRLSSRSSGQSGFLK